MNDPKDMGERIAQVANATHRIDADGWHVWTIPQAGPIHGGEFKTRSYDRYGKTFDPVAPGIYEVRGEGAVAFNVPELMTCFELDDTEENRAEIVAMLREALAAGPLTETELQTLQDTTFEKLHRDVSESTPVTFDRPTLERLRAAQATAIAEHRTEFIFEEHEYATGYAGYLIEYLDRRLPR